MKVRLISFHSSETFNIFYFYSKTIFTSIPKQLIKFRSNLVHIIKFIQIKAMTFRLEIIKKNVETFWHLFGVNFTKILRIMLTSSLIKKKREVKIYSYTP